MPRDDSLLYDLLRKGTQLTALGLDVLCGKDGTYQRHTVHAGALELQNVLLVDAANGYHRHIHGVADVQQGLPGHLAHVRLGVGGKYRAYAKVVCTVRHSVQRFLYRVGRNADHHAVAHALAHLCGCHIVLPHMDALGVALQCHAEGIHVGQDDMAAAQVRQRVGDGVMIGVSAHTVQEALDAVAHGADYLGVGAVFATHTKTDVSEMPRQTLLDICNAVDVPVVAIGGIHKENILQLKGTGVDGVALVSAIFAAKDIEAECRELRALSEQIIK